LDKSNIDEKFNRGKDFEKLGKYRKAIECYEEILKLDPKNHLVKLHLIKNYSKIGEIDKANKIQNEIDASFQKAREITDEDLKIDSLLESLIDKEEELQITKENISQKVKSTQPVILYPDNSKVIVDNTTFKNLKELVEEKYQNVLELYKSQEFEKTIMLAKEILEINRKYAPAWFIIGAVYGKLQKYQKSLVYLQKATELDPKNDQFSAWLSWVLGKLKFYKKAIQVAKKAIKNNFENFSAWQNMGIIYNILEEPRKALWCFIHANSIHEDISISKQIEFLRNKGFEPFNPQDNELKICHRCGTEVRITARFCDNCGASLEIGEKDEKWQDESVKNCLICKKDIVKEKPVVCKTCHFTFHRECLLRWVEIYKRCPNCGYEVGWI